MVRYALVLAHMIQRLTHHLLVLLLILLLGGAVGFAVTQNRGAVAEGIETSLDAESEGAVAIPVVPSPDADISAEIADEASEDVSKDASPIFEMVLLDVPYIPEAPGDAWKGPWKNACEEASIAMVHFFYQGRDVVTGGEAQEYMKMLFAEQDRRWGANANSDAERTATLVNDYSFATATVVENPSLEEIKEELRQGRPVISSNNGFELGNPNTPFLATGSGYHMMVIIGYDDATQEFIVHDDGDIPTGENHRYAYDHFMDTLHAFAEERMKTDGPPTVLFTARTE